jgi:hypothetical protein
VTDERALDLIIDRRRVVEVLVSFPDGTCFACLAQKTGLELERVITGVDPIPPRLVAYSGSAPCPFCSERRPVVSIYRAS